MNGENSARLTKNFARLNGEPLCKGRPHRGVRDCPVRRYKAQPRRLQSRHVAAIPILSTWAMAAGISAHVREVKRMSSPTVSDHPT